MKKILSLILLCCIAFGTIAGCAKVPEGPAESGGTSSGAQDPEQMPETGSESVSTETKSEMSTESGEPFAKDEPNTAQPSTEKPRTTPADNLTLYGMDLNDFYRFLEAPAETTLQEVAQETLIFPGAKEIAENRYPLRYRIFDINSDALLAFMEPENLERVLKEHGITVSVKSRSLVYEDEIGWFLFIRGEEENAYIVFDRKYTDDCPFLTYEIVCFREADFRAKYAERPCRLIVDGEDITDTCTVRLNAQSMDLPLLAILRALDYQVTWHTETGAEISGDGKIFEFDKKNGRLFCSIDGIMKDLLSPAPGGMRRWTVTDDDVLINDVNLKYLFSVLNCELSCDRDTGIITIAKA